MDKHTPLPDAALARMIEAGTISGPAIPAEASTEVGAQADFPWTLAELFRVIGMWLAGAAVIGTLALIAGYIYRRFA